uniref:SGNH_hydro domain-containing protein n=1 Tax=Trichuris muris TaxID=70415 RepID=A0A5S6QMS9_TRIMR
MSSLSDDAIASPQEDVDGDGRWFDLHEKYVAEARAKEPDVLFIGDSHIACLEQTLTYHDLFEQFHCLCFGIRGDNTSNVLWRVINGELECIHPKVIVLLVGSNNRDQTAEQVISGIVAIVDIVSAKQPQAKILLLKIPPCGHKPNKRRELVMLINAGLAKAVQHFPNCEVLDITEGLVGSDGTIERADMYDYFHLTDSGYRKAFDIVYSAVQEVVGSE